MTVVPTNTLQETKPEDWAAVVQCIFLYSSLCENTMHEKMEGSHWSRAHVTNGHSLVQTALLSACTSCCSPY